MKLKKLFTGENLIWIGLILLIIDLLSYTKDILEDFTQLGIILLSVSLILIVLGSVKRK